MKITQYRTSELVLNLQTRGDEMHLVCIVDGEESHLGTFSHTPRSSYHDKRNPLVLTLTDKGQELMRVRAPKFEAVTPEPEAKPLVTPEPF